MVPTLTRWVWRIEAMGCLLCACLVLFAPEWFVGRVVVPELRWLMLGIWMGRAMLAWSAAVRPSRARCAWLMLLQAVLLGLPVMTLEGPLLAIHVAVGGPLVAHTLVRLRGLRNGS